MIERKIFSFAFVIFLLLSFTSLASHAIYLSAKSFLGCVWEGPLYISVYTAIEFVRFPKEKRDFLVEFVFGLSGRKCEWPFRTLTSEAFQGHLYA